MSREADFWAELRRAILTDYPGSDLVRIENRISAGLPDVNGCIEGVDFWCELKCVPRVPPRGGIVQIPHYTQDQRNWIRRRGKANGRVTLALKIVAPRHYLLFHWPAAYELVGRVPFSQLTACAAMHTTTLSASTFVAGVLLQATRYDAP